MRQSLGLASLWILASILTACGSGDGNVAPNPPAPPPAPPPPPPPSPIDVVLDAPLSSGGGTLTVTKAGSPLTGLTITVPAGAFSGGTQWTVSEMKEVRPPLPAKTRQIGSTIRIRNGQGFAAKPFRLSIPARVGRDSAVAAFFRDPSTGTLELIPVGARTDTSLAILTQHLSAAQMLVPAAPNVFQGASAPAPPAAGEVEVILVGASLADLRFLIRTSFVPGVDDWEFVNRGSVLTPGGYCAGSTLSALHHHYTRKAAHGALNGLYDEVSTLEVDNPEGIRLASVVQKTGDWDGARPGIIVQMFREMLADLRVPLGGPEWVVTQAQTLALAMLTTGRAQALGIYQSDWSGGHSIVAQGIEPDVTGGQVYVSDPNLPGQERIIEFTTDAVAPFQFAQNADSPAEPYSRLVVMGVSALVDLSRFEQLWAELDAKTIGDNLFHPVLLEYRDPADTLWRPAGPLIRTASSNLTFRTLCSACEVARGPANDKLDRAFTGAFKVQGDYIGDDRSDLFPGVKVPVDLGTQEFGMTHRVLHDDPEITEWLYSHFSLLEVDRVPFRILRHRFQAIVGQEITWSVNNGGVGGSDSKYRFTFGPQSAPVETAFTGATVTHRFPAKGVYRPRVELFDAAGIRLAADSLTMAIAEGYHWRMECVDVDADSPSSSFSSAQASAYQRWITHANQVVAKPTDGFLSLLTPSTARQFASFFVVAKAGQGATAKALPLFPGDSIDSPKLEIRVFTGSAFESPGGPPGFSLGYGGGGSDNIFGTKMVTRLSFRVSGQGWARGSLRAGVSGFPPEVTIRFYARQIWERNPAPAPPCAFGDDWS